MRVWVRVWVILLPGLGAVVHAAQTSWDGEVHATASATRLTPDSVLNPDNRLARLAQSSQTLEARLNLRIESDAARLSLRSILPIQRLDDGNQIETKHAAWLSQWQARLVLTETLAASLGREVLHWGPAQFRSPSSPFYFDNGRADPTRELSGVDAARLAWTPDASHLYSLAFVRDSGHRADTAPDDWRDTWLARGEWRGDDWTAGAALAQARGRDPFLGAYAQWTLDDAWLLYGEVSSARRPHALVSPTDAMQPFSTQAQSPRRLTALLGASRTLDNGQSLHLEWLHDAHAYTRAEADAYFARAATGMTGAAQALAGMPPLLGRDTLHGVWQSPLLGDGDIWRLMWTRDVRAAGNAWAVYYDHPVDQPAGTGLNLYVLAQVNDGPARSEWAAFSRASLTLGLRLALP